MTPDTKYFFRAETAGMDGRQVRGTLNGSFRTKPRDDEPTSTIFTVITGMMYKDLDHPEGFKIFESMLKLSPNFTYMKGGFLSISVSESKISMTHHDVLGNAVYEWHKP